MTAYFTDIYASLSLNELDDIKRHIAKTFPANGVISREPLVISKEFYWSRKYYFAWYNMNTSGPSQ